MSTARPLRRTVRPTTTRWMGPSSVCKFVCQVIQPVHMVVYRGDLQQAGKHFHTARTKPLAKGRHAELQPLEMTWSVTMHSTFSIATPDLDSARGGRLQNDSAAKQVSTNASACFQALSLLIGEALVEALAFVCGVCVLCTGAPARARPRQNDLPGMRPMRRPRLPSRALYRR